MFLLNHIANHSRTMANQYQVTKAFWEVLEVFLCAHKGISTTDLDKTRK